MVLDGTSLSRMLLRRQASSYKRPAETFESRLAPATRLSVVAARIQPCGAGEHGRIKIYPIYSEETFRFRIRYH